MKRYQIIYADPPWNLHGLNKHGIVTSRDSPNNPNPAMSYDDIRKLPVKEMADENCVLFLWVVDNSLPFVFNIIKEWGFEYKSVAFTWVKKTKRGKDFFGMGQWTRKNPEMCLIAKRGTPKRISCGVRQLHYYPIAEHSKKPPEFRNEIIKLCGELPRIELFARQKTEGWDVWGNEIASDIDLIGADNENHTKR
jgi:N6-adenosine-specific RNA methylase IME4